VNFNGFVLNTYKDILGVLKQKFSKKTLIIKMFISINESIELKISQGVFNMLILMF